MVTYLKAGQGSREQPLMGRYVCVGTGVGEDTAAPWEPTGRDREASPIPAEV